MALFRKAAIYLQLNATPVPISRDVVVTCRNLSS